MAGAVMFYALGMVTLAVMGLLNIETLREHPSD